MQKVSALIVVDVQNDFCDSGATPCKNGNLVARNTFEYIQESRQHNAYQYYIASKDWHINAQDHWAETAYHCEAGTFGAELKSPLTNTNFNFMIHKAFHTETQSAFKGILLNNLETNVLAIEPAHYLHHLNITHIDVVGLARDYCVHQTAVDAASSGFYTRVLEPLTAGMSDEKPKVDTVEYVEKLDSTGIKNSILL